MTTGEAAGDEGREPRRAALLGTVRDAARAVRRRLLATRLGRRLAVLAGGAAAGQFALLLASPLVTRLYAPEDYGAFAAMSGLVAVLAVVTGLRYEGAMPLCREDADAASLAAIVVLAAATFALATAAVLAAAGPALAAGLGLGPRAIGLAWWLPPALAVQGLFLALDGWSLYRGDVRRLALSKVVQGGATAAGQLAFGVLGDGSPHGLLLAYVLGQAAGLCPAVLGLSRAQVRLLLRPAPGRVARLARRYRRFPGLEMWARSLGTAAEMLPVPLAAAVFGPVGSGLLGLAQRIVGLPIRFLGISAAQAYVAELSSLDRDDRRALRALFHETARRLLVAGAAYLAVVLLLGPRLFALAFGPAWAESGAMAQLLAPMYLAMFVNRPVRYTVQFYERQDLGLLVNAAGLAVVAAAFSLAHLGLLSLSAAVAAISVGLCLTNAVSFLVARALIDGRLPAGRAPDAKPDAAASAAVPTAERGKAR